MPIILNSFTDTVAGRLWDVTIDGRNLKLWHWELNEIITGKVSEMVDAKLRGFLHED